jgi:hypothetical protein
MLFAAEEGVTIDFELVDLFTGAHYKDDYTGDQSESPGAGARGR